MRPGTPEHAQRSIAAAAALRSTQDGLLAPREEPAYIAGHLAGWAGDACRPLDHGIHGTRGLAAFARGWAAGRDGCSR